MTVDSVGVCRFLRGVFRRQVNDQLMAEKVEIDPMIAGATFFEAEHMAIEIPSGRQVVDRDGQVKRRELHRMCLDCGYRPSLAP
ncbi:hypothetical protein D3C76_834100 [compost metagenome]